MQYRYDTIDMMGFFDEGVTDAENETEQYSKTLTAEFCISPTRNCTNTFDTIDLAQDENQHGPDDLPMP